MTTTIEMALDEGYRRRKGEEFERAKEQGIARAFRRHPARGRLPPARRPALGADPNVAPVVREVFERRAAGFGPEELANLLQARGVQTSQGSRTWSKQAVYGLRSNRVYPGELRYGADDRYINAEAHEPIVDLAAWTAAQHPNSRSLTRASKRSAWLLTGILRCHACRYAMHGTTTSRGKRIYR